MLAVIRGLENWRHLLEGVMLQLKDLRVGQWIESYIGLT